MADQPRLYQVFLASPGDVDAERELAADAIEELNITHGPLGNYRLELLRWETHAAPNAGRPQQVINDMIDTYDLFVGIMWKRFGTPTGVAESGTEEEFQRAYARWERNQALALMFFFSQKKVPPAASRQDLEQQTKVLGFKESLAGKALTWSYKNPADFAAQFRKTMAIRMTRIVADQRVAGATAATRPDPAVTEALHAVWPRFSGELQNAFSLAYNENRRAGDAGIKTRDLFAAIQRLGGEEFKPFAEALPQEALPAPTPGVVSVEPFITEEQPWLSHCVADSIQRLSKITPPDYTLTAADIFADIAKHGSGESVALLRKHNIEPKDIDEMIQAHNIPVFSGLA